MGGISDVEILDRVECEVAKREIGDISVCAHSPDATLNHHCSKTDLPAHEMDRKRHVCAQVIIHVKPCTGMIWKQETDGGHKDLTKVKINVHGNGCRLKIEGFIPS